MESVRSDQKEEAEREIGYTILGLKNDIMKGVDKEIATQETRWEVKMSEIRQSTVTRLQEIKDFMAAVRDSQQKMWGAIERMSKEL